MVEILINQLDTEIIANTFSINGQTIILENIDACGVIDMSVHLFKTLFFYQLDSYIDKIKYYTVHNPDFVFNPTNAKLDRVGGFGEIATVNTNLMDIKNDYMKYIALKLFGTHYGINLFKNITEMLNFLSTISETALSNVYGTLMTSYNYIDGNSADITTNTQLDQVYDYRTNRYVYKYTKYTTDTFDTNNNLCRELLLQLLELAPERFNDISNSYIPQPLPFMVGDIINFKISIHAAAGQELITRASPIPVRTYQIKILLNNDAYKPLLSPQTKASVQYVDTNPFPRLNFTNYNELELYDYTLFYFSVYFQTATTNINNGTNTGNGTISHVTGMIQIYPKAFNGTTTFPFNNVIQGNSNYETNTINRMFYIHNMVNVNSAADLLSITVNATTGDFIFNINTETIVQLQVELQNNGKLPIQNIASKNFDINFI